MEPFAKFPEYWIQTLLPNQTCLLHIFNSINWMRQTQTAEMFVAQEQFWFRKQTHKVTQQSQGQAISTHTYTHTPISAQGSRVWNASLQSLLLLIWFIIYHLSSPPSTPGGVCGWRWGQREWYKNNWRTELRLSSLQSGKMAAGDNVLMHATVAAPIHAF